MNKRFENYIHKLGKSSPVQLSIEQLFEYQQSIEPLTQMYKDVFDLYKDVLDINQAKEMFIEAASTGRCFYCVQMIEDFAGFSDVPPFEPQYTQPYEIGIRDFY